MPSKIAIVTDWFFLQDGSRLGTGGTETYIRGLGQLARRLGYEVSIFQRGVGGFSKQWNDIPVRAWDSFESQYRLLREFHGGTRGATIYSDLHLMPPLLFRPAIGLQHGIYWDVRFRRFGSNLLQWPLNWLKGARAVAMSRRCLRALNALDATITVDTNFQNWMRTMCGWADLESKWEFIPNFADPVSEVLVRVKLDTRHSAKRILFARRFELHRGTFLWADVVERMAPRYPSVEFAIRGRDGAAGAERLLRRRLDRFPNVNISEQPHDQMANEHYSADIEVVPSYGSEGTSLSLIEAMASGTCVVTTCVGGLPNVIVPGFNGLLVQPSSSAIEAAVEKVVADHEERRRLAWNAYRTVVDGLSRQHWEEKVTALLFRVFGQPSDSVVP